MKNLPKSLSLSLPGSIALEVSCQAVGRGGRGSCQAVSGGAGAEKREERGVGWQLIRTAWSNGLWTLEVCNI